MLPQRIIRENITVCRLKKTMITIAKVSALQTLSGKALLSFADKDNSIYAVTAAMKYGTGLQHFYKAFPGAFL